MPLKTLGPIGPRAVGERVNEPALSVYNILYIGKGGGGRRSERRYSRGATVHEYSSFDHGGNSSQAGLKNTNHE